MPDELKTISISRDREITLVKGRRADQPDALHLFCSTCTETDAERRRIPVSKGAVQKVIGGPLTWKDYDSIASILLDESVVGENVASIAKAYQDRVRSDEPLTFSDPWMNLLNAFESNPMQEILMLALRASTFTDRHNSPPQPFESP